MFYYPSDDKYDDQEYLHQFEISMAISDLIFELNRIMDWHTSTNEDQSEGKTQDHSI